MEGSTCRRAHIRKLKAKRDTSSNNSFIRFGSCEGLLTGAASIKSEISSDFHIENGNSGKTESSKIAAQGMNTLNPLTTSVGNESKNPVMLASGTAGHGTELSSVTDLSGVGAGCQSLSAYEWEGNSAPRLYETPNGMINSIGLQDRFVILMEDILPQLIDKEITVVLSIGEGQLKIMRQPLIFAPTCPQQLKQ